MFIYKKFKVGIQIISVYILPIKQKQLYGFLDIPQKYNIYAEMYCHIQNRHEKRSGHADTSTVNTFF